jgi:hypothetical protein
MRLSSLLRPTLAALAAALAVSGCVSAEMTQRYEQSLARWKGAPAADLERAWGPPQKQEPRADGSVLATYVVHHDMDNGQHSQRMTSLSDGTGHVGTMVTGVAVAPSAPVTCTTRFVERAGIVESWTFSGVGCGAPDE